jgi:hypothetical protein
MKKLLLAVAAITITAATVNAQTTFSIAANAGSGTAQYYKLSAGGDIQADFPATTGLKITGSAGYQNFAKEVGTVKSHFSVIPILAGAKFNLGKALYGHAQLGYSFLTSKVSGSNQNNGEFSFAPSLGYGFGKSFDISAKYLSVGKVNAILARLAYTFGN